MIRDQIGGYTTNTPTGLRLTEQADYESQYKLQQAAREQMKEPTATRESSLAEVIANIYDAVNESTRLTACIDSALYGATPCDPSDAPSPHSIDSAARIIYSQLCQHNDELRSILNRLGG